MFDDKTGEKRSPEDLNSMIEEIRLIANKYDFDLDSCGDSEIDIKAMNYYKWKLSEPKIK